MYKCECGFEAKSNAGLASHKRNCKPELEVIDSLGNIVRVYSLKVHGNDYQKLAKKFITKFPNNKIK